MSDHRQARILVGAAEKDITALRGMNDADIFADEIFGFHAQQAVEKLFKAWLALLGRTYPPIHDLSELLSMLIECQSDAARFEPLIEYTPYAVQFRYGIGDTGSVPLDRDAALLGTEALLAEVQCKLPDEDDPTSTVDSRK